MLLVLAISVFSQTWEKINTGFNYILMGIEFPGGQSLTGFAGGESVTYMGDGIVIKTTDGGTTWSQLWTGTDQGIEGISFPDLNTGYVCGWSSYFAKTTNGGVSWTAQTPGTDIYIYTDVDFKDALHGVVTAQTNDGSAVYATSDGGATWTAGTGLTAIPYALCHVTGDTYFLVTNTGLIQKSINGGLTWTTVYNGGGLLTGIDFFNESIGMAAGEDGKIFKTYDGGSTWQSQTIASGFPLWHDFAWYDQSTVYVCGTPEMIYKSVNGGSSWVDDYVQSTYEPALYEVMFTNDGTGYLCGSQGWFYRLAPQLQAAFAADNSAVCQGGTVHFTDQSAGAPTGWNWTFEGGTPSTSTLQNPIVTYATPGVYDVTLTITKSTLSNTLTKPDMIQVQSPVTATPSQPTGPVEICGLTNNEYSTQEVTGATSYTWVATPASAGTFAGAGLTSTLTASNTWNGAFTVKVAGANACGNGPYSTELAALLYHQPVVYSLYSGGGYCAETDGYDIKLEDSEVGVNYELFKNGTTMGLIMAGTGELLNFGPQPEGEYTVTASNGYCSGNMMGVAQNFIIPVPGQAAEPTGPAIVCNNDVSAYSAVLPADGYWLLWTLGPANAGTLSQPGLTTAEIAWNPDFEGVAELLVQGVNECDTGVVSPVLHIQVNAVPQPVVAGDAIVCILEETVYSVAATTGSTYTWNVIGGTITTGQGTHEITIEWGATAGTGSVMVTEDSEQGCAGNSALFPVEIEVCSGMGDTFTSGILLYPNPARESFTLQLSRPLEQDAVCSITDATGKVVKSFVVPAGKTAVPDSGISHFPKGFYLVRLVQESYLLFEGRVIKE